jgi:hypothetical protein
MLRPGLAVASAALLGLTALAVPGGAQQFETRSPTAQDWAAMASLPDFNGVWERGGGPRGGGAGARGGGARGGARGGGRGRGGPSLTAKAQALQQAFRAVSREDSETANCLPPGMPGIMGQPYPMEFLLTPGKVTIVIEAYTQVRHIYTDGRPLPEDPNPEFHGNSIGHWEDDTLVVETVGFSPLTSLTGGVPFSERATIVERIELADPDTMTIETTITDPEMLTEPSTTTAYFQRHRDWTITEYICEENNRNSVDSQGNADIDVRVPDSPR